MVFEGSEKKLEIVFNAQACTLREKPLAFWQQVVAKAEAEILSVTSNEHQDAYILSESSLFVWDHKLVILTCGLSTLIDAACFVIEHFGKQAIDFVCYQRKNEYFANEQASSFVQDATRLNALIPGQARRIGHLDSHHHFLFTSDSHFRAEKADVSCELMMYHITGNVADYLRAEGQLASTIRKQLQLDDLFTGFSIDEHLFSPLGYSVNGIRGNEYFTIHITPQEQSSYVSLETNVNPQHHGVDFVGILLDLLQPTSWDIIGFNCQIPRDHFPQHHHLGECAFAIAQGYKININHFQQQHSEKMAPTILPC
ncbi:adenosylmethionine decarboxylase [Shewanella maritima]|uniref:adenosylmethionine decarboxylase n=1 Tax=Shewanella maritima TaxID=2520507 RepID=UPI0037353F9F